MGKRGPKPGSGGRPRKAISEKLIEGNPGKRPLMILKNIPELEGAEMPPPRDYLSDEQKNGTDFPAKEIYTTVWNWLQERKCAQHVSAELVEHYAVSAARLIQCEQAISNYGFIAKNAQGGAIISPYVTAAHDYMKQANRLWDMIYNIVRENCTEEYGGSNPQEDMMEKLLRSRGV